MFLLSRPSNFLLQRYFGDAHHLMYNKSSLFVYKFIDNCHFFQIRPIKLKIRMLYHNDNTFRQSVLYIYVFNIETLILIKQGIP